MSLLLYITKEMSFLFRVHRGSWFPGFHDCSGQEKKEKKEEEDWAEEILLSLPLDPLPISLSLFSSISSLVRPLCAAHN